MSKINVVKLIKEEDNKIIEKIGMANLPLIVYVFQKKYKHKVSFIDINGDCMIRYGNTNVANMSYLPTILHYLKISENKLCLTGNIVLPYGFKYKAQFFVEINKKNIEIALCDVLPKKYVGRQCYEYNAVFSFEYSLKNVKDLTIRFGYITNGIKSYCGKINSMRFMPVADVISKQYAILNNWCFYIVNGTLKAELVDEKYAIDVEKAYCEQIKRDLLSNSKTIIDIRRDYFERKKTKQRKIWLFFDRIDKADDNAEVLFKYVIRQNLNVDCYYVISADCEDYKRLLPLGNIVDAYSKERKVLHLLADCIITSQLNGFVENPYGEYEEFFRDLYHSAKVVFLQHGVTKDDQSTWLGYFNQNLSAIVVSSKVEESAFFEQGYMLEKQKIWRTGMPRYDELRNRQNKYILIMPTWRKEIMEQRFIRDKEIYTWCLKDGFEKSEYFKRYNKLINSPFLHRMAKKFGLEILFMPHPIMQPYINEFVLNDKVKVLQYNTSWNEIFAESVLMITDYSSVAFDFAYLKKKIIYYQFDKKRFFKSHAYKKGYFDYKKSGFGKVVKTHLGLLVEIMLSSSKAFDNNNKYIKRTKDFFAYDDKNNCRRVLTKILELENYSEFY